MPSKITKHIKKTPAGKAASTRDKQNAAYQKLLRRRPSK